MPKNSKQTIVVVVLGFLAISALQNVYDLIFRDPFPELTESIKETEQRADKLQKMLEEINRERDSLPPETE